MTESLSGDMRLEEMKVWLRQVLGHDNFQIEIASGDASFRRYFRLHAGADSRIVMDAPPTKEDCRPFIEIARALLQTGLNLPQILHQDLDKGFLLLSDLGHQQYLQVLTPENVEDLYDDAMASLITLQARAAEHYSFPTYNDTLLMNEMYLFRDWLLEKHLAMTLSITERNMLDGVFRFLSESAREQPQVPVHRDYHSRNLMYLSQHNPGILDFQDAVLGPVTYDLVSLLRDCYISWPRQQIEDWVRGYHKRALQSGILRVDNEALFLRWFDLMGVQRHLKAAGIFARLCHRDHKPAYLDDIPRTVGYIIEVSSRYPELQELHQFLVQVEGLPRSG